MQGKCLSLLNVFGEGGAENSGLVVLANNSGAMMTSGKWILETPGGSAEFQAGNKQRAAATLTCKEQQKVCGLI